MSFPCTRCGLCCQQIQHVAELKNFHSGDGVCFHYRQGHGCAIYQQRPMECRIDEGYQQYFEGQFSVTEYYQKNAQVCNRLQSAAKFPMHYRIKIDHGY